MICDKLLFESKPDNTEQMQIPVKYVCKYILDNSFITWR